MRFASLGSGSAGNALVVEAGGSRLLLDCGFGLRETAVRLARLGLTPHDLSGILVTHEHSDHAQGVFKLARKYQLPVWLTSGTFVELGRDWDVLPAVHLIDVDSRFAVDDLAVEAFPVPHDAREPVQYVFTDGARRLGVLTDIGSSTPHVQSMLSGCHALVLETNHDEDMLWKGSYPRMLKQRVGGRFGHLSNAAAGELLRTLDRGRLQHLVAAHLSQQNNMPDLARSALSGALGCEEEWIAVADQDNGFGWREIF